jgi:seryl-tRNA synthetase
MLDIALLRRDLPHVLARLQTRKNPQVFLNETAFQALEAERKTLQTRTEELQAKRNSLSKQIGQLKAKGESADAVMAEVGQLKDELDASAVRLDALQSELQTLLLAVPNLPQEGVPVGADEHGNVELRRWAPMARNPKRWVLMTKTMWLWASPWVWILRWASSSLVHVLR